MDPIREVIRPTLLPACRLPSKAVVTRSGPSVLTSNWSRMASKSMASTVSLHMMPALL